MEEKKRKRGRPATGRRRTENLALRLTPKVKKKKGSKYHD